ncbi:HD domain-containing phosphohydrolase [Hydrogenovibrio kuenenii]|uniref:HD domain-containing phosphohydrolase n=1 Tax=Hydrogenovibrio kuenenii TaxID=63658 RepID=UPI0004636B87|nr:HD domain-containing phosphohydrolase [Hydrogenovibrio kuenenii]
MFSLTESKSQSFGEQLSWVRSYLNQRLSFIHRIGVALYDETTGSLKTFAFSGDEAENLTFYEYKLSNSESLRKLKETRQPRIVQDITAFSSNGREHTESIRKAGYKSSYIVPIYDAEKFIGMVSFNSKEKDYFQDDVIIALKLAVNFISLLMTNLKRTQHTLEATIQTTLELTHEKDPETREHVSRVAYYARHIAKGVASKYQLNDEFIEYVFMFSPLHDIGKISIPDDILRKPGKLTVEEFEVMKTHTIKGYDLSKTMLKNYGLEKIKQAGVIKNIIRSHHEKLDGSGYPDGLKEKEIPTEAKIVAVADIFDALTTVRPYKLSWSNEEAFEELLRMSNKGLLCQSCVQALIEEEESIQEIQTLLADKRPA